MWAPEGSPWSTNIVLAIHIKRQTPRELTFSSYFAMQFPRFLLDETTRLPKRSSKSSGRRSLSLVASFLYTNLASLDKIKLDFIFSRGLSRGGSICLGSSLGKHQSCDHSLAVLLLLPLHRNHTHHDIIRFLFRMIFLLLHHKCYIRTMYTI